MFANLTQARALGYPETFIRMWEYYLCYCEGGFHERAIGDVQMLLSKPLCRRAPIQHRWRSGNTSRPVNLSLINIVSFQTGWFACVLGAAHGRPLLGPVVVAVLLGLHLYLTADVKREIRLLVVAGVLGFLLDSLQALLGVFSFGKSGALSWVSPLWMTALWPNFATALHTSLSWLAGRYILAAVLGAVAGPLSYYAGAQLGALSLHPHLVVSMVALSVVWGVVMPVLLHLAMRAK